MWGGWHKSCTVLTPRSSPDVPSGTFATPSRPVQDLCRDLCQPNRGLGLQRESCSLGQGVWASGGLLWGQGSFAPWPWGKPMLDCWVHSNFSSFIADTCPHGLGLGDWERGLGYQSVLLIPTPECTMPTPSRLQFTFIKCSFRSGMQKNQLQLLWCTSCEKLSIRAA